ncbi:hypothetical protein VPHD479_0238 [Vibrio phage D479]
MAHPIAVGIKTGIVTTAAILTTISVYNHFKLPDNIPLRNGVYTISGSITKQTAEDFLKVSRNEGLVVETVKLNSQGGAAWSALDIADEVDLKGYDTLLSPGDQCDSACTFVFLAGDTIKMGDEIGFHEPSTAGIPFRKLTGSRKKAAEEFEVMLTKKMFNYGFKPEMVEYMFSVHNETVEYVDIEKLKGYRR